jgi:hypothetical protein
MLVGAIHGLIGWYAWRQAMAIEVFTIRRIVPTTCSVNILSAPRCVSTAQNRIATKVAAKKARPTNWSVASERVVNARVKRKHMHLVAERMRSLRSREKKEKEIVAVAPVVVSPSLDRSIPEKPGPVPAVTSDAQADTPVSLVDHLNAQTVQWLQDELARVWQRPYGMMPQQECCIKIVLSADGSVDTVCVATSSQNPLYDMSLCAAFRLCHFPAHLYGREFIVACP